MGEQMGRLVLLSLPQPQCFIHSLTVPSTTPVLIVFRRRDLMILHHYNISSFQSFAFYLSFNSCFSFLHY